MHNVAVDVCLSLFPRSASVWGVLRLPCRGGSRCPPPHPHPLFPQVHKSGLYTLLLANCDATNAVDVLVTGHTTWMNP